MSHAPQCARPGCTERVRGRNGRWQTYCCVRCAALVTAKQRATDRVSTRLADLRALLASVAVGTTPVDMAAQQIHAQQQRAEHRGYIRAMAEKQAAAKRRAA